MPSAKPEFLPDRIEKLKAFPKKAGAGRRRSPRRGFFQETINPRENLPSDLFCNIIQKVYYRSLM
jgi:hypothetical protein